MDVVHLDEKYFYLTLNKRKYYLGNEDRGPYRTTNSNQFTKKVVFIYAVDRP